MKFINIGFGNLVSADRVIAICSPDAAPIKRLVQDAKAENRVIDASAGKKTRAVIVTDSDHVVLSSLMTETLIKRLSGDGEDAEAEEADRK